MNIASFQKVSLIDMPQYISSVIYTQGCNRACSYCQNPETIPQERQGQVAWLDIWNHLMTRLGKIDAVVFSGGEPTLQEDLIWKMEACKEKGFKIGLHTNGEGKYFEEVTPLCDYILLSHHNKEKIKIAQKAKHVQLSTVVKENGKWKNNIREVAL